VTEPNYAREAQDLPWSRLQDGRVERAPDGSPVPAEPFGEWSWQERRGYIWRLWTENGKMYGVPQSVLAERFGVSVSQISLDYSRIRKWLGEIVEERTQLRTVLKGEQAIEDAEQDGEQSVRDEYMMMRMVALDRQRLGLVEQPKRRAEVEGEFIGELDVDLTVGGESVKDGGEEE